MVFFHDWKNLGIYFSEWTKVALKYITVLIFKLFCRILAISPPLQPIPSFQLHTFSCSLFQSFGAKMKLVVSMIFKSPFNANCEYQRTLVPVPAILGTSLLTFKFRNVSFYVSKKVIDIQIIGDIGLFQSSMTFTSRRYSVGKREETCQDPAASRWSLV